MNLENLAANCHKKLRWLLTIARELLACSWQEWKFPKILLKFVKTIVPKHPFLCWSPPHLHTQHQIHFCTGLCEKNQHIKRIIIKLFIILMMAAASPATFNPSISAYTLMTAVIALIRKKRHSPALSEHSIRKFTVHLHRHVGDLAIKGFRTPHIYYKRLLLGALCFFGKMTTFLKNSHRNPFPLPPTRFLRKKLWKSEKFMEWKWN